MRSQFLFGFRDESCMPLIYHGNRGRRTEYPIARSKRDAGCAPALNSMMHRGKRATGCFYHSSVLFLTGSRHVAIMIESTGRHDP